MLLASLLHCLFSHEEYHKAPKEHTEKLSSCALSDLLARTFLHFLYTHPCVQVGGIQLQIPIVSFDLFTWAMFPINIFLCALAFQCVYTCARLCPRRVCVCLCVSISVFHCRVDLSIPALSQIRTDTALCYEPKWYTYWHQHTQAHMHTCFTCWKPMHVDTIRRALLTSQTPKCLLSRPSFKARFKRPFDIFNPS